ncbi:hydrogenase maturation nickel metallochaperone HypA [Helicobacter pametensis]|uniref:hydrogenase maturation nickel metallochaperone HypA/HybF n=1 Tax=Helicobacter pametensis TaxID=95149 RepID=UPI00048805E5|nr:hydrogenase maturation nickel metallochaperone HypA [Helicobacter pametensis]
MHEYSIVQSFMQMCEDYVKQNECTKVLSAKIKAGVFSGIELSLFERALEGFKEGSVLEDAKISYVIQPLKILCRDCHTTQEVQTPICPSCHSQNTEVLDGEEFVLLSLEME